MRSTWAGRGGGGGARSAASDARSACASALLGRWYPDRLPTAIGIAYSAFGVGTVLFVPLVQYLVGEFDWRATYRIMGWMLLALLLLQIGLGIANVLLRLPLALAVAHNGGAALLLVTLVVLNFRLSPKSLR